MFSLTLKQLCSAGVACHQLGKYLKWETWEGRSSDIRSLQPAPMETLLKELLSASKLLSEFKEMYNYENRLKTFANWPFVKNCKCSPENVSLIKDTLTLSCFWYAMKMKLLMLVCLCSRSIVSLYLIWDDKLGGPTCLYSEILQQNDYKLIYLVCWSTYNFLYSKVMITFCVMLCGYLQILFLERSLEDCSTSSSRKDKIVEWLLHESNIKK